MKMDKKPIHKNVHLQLYHEIDILIAVTKIVSICIFLVFLLFCFFHWENNAVLIVALARERKDPRQDCKSSLQSTFIY